LEIAETLQPTSESVSNGKTTSSSSKLHESEKNCIIADVEILSNMISGSRDVLAQDSNTNNRILRSHIKNRKQTIQLDDRQEDGEIQKVDVITEQLGIDNDVQLNTTQTVNTIIDNFNKKRSKIDRIKRSDSDSQEELAVKKIKMGTKKSDVKPKRGRPKKSCGAIDQEKTHTSVEYNSQNPRRSLRLNKKIVLNDNCSTSSSNEEKTSVISKHSHE
jgi:hypothetical protein